MKPRNWLSVLAVLALISWPAVSGAQVEEFEDPVEAPLVEDIELAPAILEGAFDIIEGFVAQPRIRAPRPIPAGAAPAPGDEKEAKPEEKEEPEVEAPRKERAPLPPRYMVLKLLDGSTIAGELSVNEIKVATEFGELTVPVAKIKTFVPGLDSNTKVAEDLKAKLMDLESDDYKTREQAHKDLAAMGPKISRQLVPYASSENAEVKRHVTEILKEFEQQAEEADEDEEGENKANQAWINQDTIETTDFTVIGKISPARFEVASKYGPLTIALGDIVQASRPLDTRESIRKLVSVPGQNLAQRSFKSTNIRVQAGDRVTITSTGTITMSPWGSNASSGPDGMPNYGWYVPGSIPGGALVYRIGDKGQVTKAGSKVTFTAKTSGVLQLAVGMMPEYANEGYNFPGEFKARIKVDPQ